MVSLLTSFVSLPSLNEEIKGGFLRNPEKFCNRKLIHVLVNVSRVNVLPAGCHPGSASHAIRFLSSLFSPQVVFIAL